MKTSAILLILFSGWFITSLSLSPIYIAFIIAVFALILQILRNVKYHLRVRFDFSMKMCFVFILYIFFTQVLIMSNLSSATINILFSLIYLLIISISITYLSIDDIKKYFRLSVNLIIPLLCVEAAYRWMHPTGNNIGVTEYYKYKYSSIMYQDSNFVGIFIVTMFFMCTYMRRIHKVSLKKQQVILFMLAVLTLSKASIATIIVFTIIFDLSIKKWIKVGLISLVGIFALPLFLQQIQSDGSLLGKLNILNHAVLWWKKTSLAEKVFGVGFGNAVSAIGSGSHNIIVSYFVESGACGLIIFVIFLVSLFYQAGKNSAMIIFPFMLNAMSLSSHASPYFYCYLAMMIYLERVTNEKVEYYEKTNSFVLKQELL